MFLSRSLMTAKQAQGLPRPEGPPGRLRRRPGLHAIHVWPQGLYGASTASVHVTALPGVHRTGEGIEAPSTAA